MIPLTIIGCTFTSLWFFAVLWFTDRLSARKHTERQEERAHQQMLLQRIQAPEQAVTQHIIQSTPQEPVEPPQRDYDPAWDMLGVDPLAVE